MTAANDLLRPIHDRMPVILAPADFGAWLDATTPLEEAKAFLRPAPPDALRAWPVSTHVNKPANDEPECIASVGAEVTGDTDGERPRAGGPAAGKAADAE